MTNAEFYKEEIQKFDPEQFCEDFVEPNILEKRGLLCRELGCAHCKALMVMWLMEEHKEPAVDWENVPVDTPVLCRDRVEEAWCKRHFAKVDSEGTIWAYNDGRTSFSSDDEEDMTYWRYAKLWKGSEEQAAEQDAQED